jgi:hypothetical protein
MLDFFIASDDQQVVVSRVKTQLRPLPMNVE